VSELNTGNFFYLEHTESTFSLKN